MRASRHDAALALDDERGRREAQISGLRNELGRAAAQSSTLAHYHSQLRAGSGSGGTEGGGDERITWLGPPSSPGAHAELLRSQRPPPAGSADWLMMPRRASGGGAGGGGDAWGAQWLEMLRSSRDFLEAQILAEEVQDDARLHASAAWSAEQARESAALALAMELEGKAAWQAATLDEAHKYVLAEAHAFDAKLVKAQAAFDEAESDWEGRLFASQVDARRFDVELKVMSDELHEREQAAAYLVDAHVSEAVEAKLSAHSHAEQLRALDANVLFLQGELKQMAREAHREDLHRQASEIALGREVASLEAAASIPSQFDARIPGPTLREAAVETIRGFDSERRVRPIELLALESFMATCTSMGEARARAARAASWAGTAPPPTMREAVEYALASLGVEQVRRRCSPSPQAQARPHERKSVDHPAAVSERHLSNGH